jgi:hypothetical protein
MEWLILLSANCWPIRRVWKKPTNEVSRWLRCKWTAKKMNCFGKMREDINLQEFTVPWSRRPLHSSRCFVRRRSICFPAVVSSSSPRRGSPEDARRGRHQAHRHLLYSASQLAKVCCQACGKSGRSFPVQGLGHNR